MELVGLRVYNLEKVGKDAGELCGLSATGVKATANIDDIIAVKPDCLMYFPAIAMTNVDDLCAILEAGINIVTLIAEFYHAPSLDPGVRERVETACKTGNSSLFATGPNPGFASGILPLGAISFQRRLDAVTLYEYADMSSRTADMNKDLWGWDPADRTTLDTMNSMILPFYGDALKQTAELVGLPLEKTTIASTVALATQDVDIQAMNIPQGSVAGYKFEVSGWRNGKKLMQFYATWWVTPHIDKDWELRAGDGWRLVVEGDSPLDINIMFAPYDVVGNSSGYNAHICVNSVPNCVAAKPGILTPADMPPVVARFG